MGSMATFTPQCLRVECVVERGDSRLGDVQEQAIAAAEQMTSACEPSGERWRLAFCAVVSPGGQDAVLLDFEIIGWGMD